MDNVQGGIARLEGDVSTLKSDVTTLKSDVSTLKTDVATLKSDVSSLKSDVSTLKIDVATLRSDMTDVKLIVGRMEERLNATLPHLATKADVAEKPSKTYMWGIMAALLTAYACGLAALAVLR